MSAIETFLCGFDSEDDGKGHPYLWCFTHREGSHYTRHQGDARQYIANLADASKAKGERLQAWATNLEYDLCNLFDHDTIREVRLRFGRSALCGATWRRADFRDTIRHLPASVEKLGEMVGLTKREKDLFDSGSGSVDFGRALVRCQHDSAITYQAAKLFTETYQALGERPRMTLASTALNLWKREYWGREVSKPAPDVWQAALEAYHGGRTQAFSVGTFENVTALDVASMFPWAMTCKPLPLPWGLFREVLEGSEVRDFGIYRVRVDSRLSLPLLPVRSKHGTIYPKGTWQAWYVGEEIREAMAHGVRIQVEKGYEFGEACNPFTSYVETLFALKQSARGGMREIYKTMLNALYGKFGQQGKHVTCVPIEKMLAMKNPPLEWRPFMGLAIFNEDATPPPWSNNIWPAFITARARVALWRKMRELEAKMCRVLYCDTDSIFYQSRGRIIKHAKKAANIGDFELRGEFSRMEIIGKKEYALEIAPGEWKPYVKGVPLAARMEYIRTGHATFSRPTKIRESARTDLTPNVWREVSKHRRTDLRKAARSDGSLSTPVITGANNQPAGGKINGKAEGRKAAHVARRNRSRKGAR